MNTRGSRGREVGSPVDLLLLPGDTRLTTPPGPMMNRGVAVWMVSESGLSGFVLIWFCIAT